MRAPDAQPQRAAPWGLVRAKGNAAQTSVSILEARISCGTKTFSTEANDVRDLGGAEQTRYNDAQHALYTYRAAPLIVQQPALDRWIALHACVHRLHHSRRCVQVCWHTAARLSLNSRHSRFYCCCSSHSLPYHIPHCHYTAAALPPAESATRAHLDPKQHTMALRLHTMPATSRAAAPRRAALAPRCQASPSTASAPAAHVRRHQHPNTSVDYLSMSRNVQ